MWDFIKDIAYQLRVHHWVKNLLLFTVPLTAHLENGYGEVFWGFISFSLIASSVYLANDLFDIKSDQNHPHKKCRPLASGRMSVNQVKVLWLICLLLGLFGAYLINQNFFGIILLYIGLNFLYSYKLKRVALVDVFFLAGMYVLRCFAGGFIVQVRPGEWFVSFCLFIFMSLAFLKRYIEVSDIGAECKEVRESRGYKNGDASFLYGSGLLCGLISSLILCLYLNSERVLSLYQSHEVIWWAVPLYLYWILRLWFLAQRGVIQHDPVVFILRDWLSYVNFLIIFGLVYLAV